MKLIASALGMLCCLVCFSQPGTSPIVSHVYSVEKISQSKSGSGAVFSGSSAKLENQQMQLVTLPKGESAHFAEDNNGQEQFFVIGTGQVTAILNGQSTLLERGSVIVVLPGDKLTIKNNSTSAVKYYQMKYRSAAPDAERGKKAGPSFVINWPDMVFKPHDKGGVRQLFDRPTTMLNRFDIHVTTLNPGLKSHDPHTHVNEEIILLLEGNAEMQIGTDHQKANPGDVVFLGSNVLHNLSNIGTVPCLYFAIQWN